MSINFYEWSKTDEVTKARVMHRSGADIAQAAQAVAPIIADVKVRGDAALIDYAKTFDGADLTSIKASAEDFARAEENLDEDLKAAIKHCVGNVKKFHEEQMRRVESDWMVEIEPGVFAGECVNAIESVGLYVPRGKGAFPSAMYMLAVPAIIAGVQNVAVVTPPTPGGSADDASLYTAKLCGVRDVYKVGGAQAIAALAYGTETVPKVRKVLGPGSSYVAAAKRLLSDVIDPGMPAGPSESIILADGSADPHNTCLDILNEAEHGKDSAALLITHDKTLAEYVIEHLPNVIEALPQPHRDICAHVMGRSDDSWGYGGVILTDSLGASIALANEYAAEHLHLKISEENLALCLPRVCGDLSASEQQIPACAGNANTGNAFRIKHAGEILMGEHTASSLGNYGIGVNHVLPTGGWAHTFSCTSVWDFLKRTSLARVDRQGLEALKGAVTTLTDYEGFPAHGDVLRKRKI